MVAIVAVDTAENEPLKFDHFVVKSEKGLISNLSTKVVQHGSTTIVIVPRLARSKRGSSRSRKYDERAWTHTVFIFLFDQPKDFELMIQTHEKN